MSDNKLPEENEKDYLKNLAIMIPEKASKSLSGPIFSFDVSKLDMQKIERDGVTIYTNRKNCPRNEQQY